MIIGVRDFRGAVIVRIWSTAGRLGLLHNRRCTVSAIAIDNDISILCGACTMCRRRGILRLESRRRGAVWLFRNWLDRLLFLGVVVKGPSVWSCRLTFRLSLHQLGRTSRLWIPGRHCSCGDTVVPIHHALAAELIGFQT